jgi:hypothetical protein
MSPFDDGTFVVCSAHHPRWLKTDSQDEMIWSKSYATAARFDLKSFHEMLINNKWLDSADLWFQR